MRLLKQYHFEGATSLFGSYPFHSISLFVMTYFLNGPYVNLQQADHRAFNVQKPCGLNDAQNLSLKSCKNDKNRQVVSREKWKIIFFNTPYPNDNSKRQIDVVAGGWLGGFEKESFDVML